MIKFNAIGYAQTNYKDINDIPIHDVEIADNLAKLIINKELQLGLQDLAEFSHIYVISHLHEIRGSNLTVIPCFDTKPHGVFTTRSPRRPNPIGLSIVEVDHIDENIIYVKNIDLVDGTPILDIKPYTQAFDSIEGTRDGWHEYAIAPETIRSDNCFKNKGMSKVIDSTEK